ncbi:OmpA family protein [Dysgonomonas alginatilytica]|uniref:OmpA family protein n=1 Tax=Dysgonomonas alginatilytica TaxID=1605892 RepID=A0A2V3PMJ7_9BACT|nr:OmpA family protein [Dysgonomonas alginatilytica]PXV62100.1 OmpA family protein [Dysgonomonas alginatilytica]
MNKKDFIISFLFITSLFSLSAQEESSRTLVSEEVEYGQPNQTYNTYKTTWKKNRFKDNWSISIGGGGQVLMGIDDDKAPFKERVTFAPQFTISKYFSPIWGLRLNFTGGSLHGFNDGVSGTYVKWNHGDRDYMGKGYAGRPGYPTSTGVHFLTWDPQWSHMGFTLNDPDINKRIILDNGAYKWVPGMSGELYMEETRYAQANIDFMVDFFNLVGNYNPKRLFELTPFGGIGLYRTFAYRGGINMWLTGIHGGLIAKFRVSDRIGVNAEFSGSMLSDNFDGHTGDDQNADIIAQSTLSLAYKFGRTDWEVAEPMDYELVNRLNDEINTLRERNAKLAAKECPTCPPPPPVVKSEPTTSSDIKFLPDPVFFRIDKAIIDPTEWAKIDKAARYLTDHPDVNVVVTGYADKKTAYPEYNMKLSERRAKTVSQALIEKYGINPLRVSINWSGDQIQPFKINEWNRVVIFVIE